MLSTAAGEEPKRWAKQKEKEKGKKGEPRSLSKYNNIYNTCNMDGSYQLLTSIRGTDGERWNMGWKTLRERSG